MIASLKSMVRDDDGASVVEYGLLIAFIALVALVAIQVLGQNLSTVFSTVAGSI